MAGLVAVVLMLLVVAVLDVGRVRRWPATEPFFVTWRRVRPWLVASVRTAPVTYLYLSVIAVTTWVLATSNPGVDRRLLLNHSTNLHQLGDRPLSALFSSAFYLDSPWLIAVWLVAFSLVVAPAERWLGSIRLVVVFASGHVIATVVTAILIDWWDIAADTVGVIDVGTSYGFAAVVGVFTYRLRRPWNLGWAVTWLGLTALAMRVDDSFVSVGHCVALLTGFGLVGVTRASTVRARRRLPWFRPPEWAVALERQWIRSALAGRVMPGEATDEST